jgi:hypothetical protein
MVRHPASNVTQRRVFYSLRVIVPWKLSELHFLDVDKANRSLAHVTIKSVCFLVFDILEGQLRTIV